MYYYIYDIFTASKKYQNQLLKIEGLLTEFGFPAKDCCSRSPSGFYFDKNLIFAIISPCP